MGTYLVDLAQAMPEDLLKEIGELTVLFGRLDHMVLLAIKRKRQIPLTDAQRLYKGYSLGSKLFGKGNGEIGLKALIAGDEQLEAICGEIHAAVEQRNRLLHGLITTVVDKSVVIHNAKVYSVAEAELWSLRETIIALITRLNEAIPIPGLTASWASGPALDISYDALAMERGDPPVSVLDEKG